MSSSPLCHGVVSAQAYLSLQYSTFCFCNALHVHSFRILSSNFPPSCPIFFLLSFINFYNIAIVLNLIQFRPGLDLKTCFFSGPVNSCPHPVPFILVSLFLVFSKISAWSSTEPLSSHCKDILLISVLTYILALFWFCSCLQFHFIFAHIIDIYLNFQFFLI